MSSLLRWIVGGTIGTGIVHLALDSAKKRKKVKIPCRFLDGISESEFAVIAKRSSRRYKYITNLSVTGPVVFGVYFDMNASVEAEFEIDFNDSGHLTGEYLIHTQLKDISPLNQFAESIKRNIENFPACVDDLFDEELDEEDSRPSYRKTVCPYCGNEIKPYDAVFCPACGRRLSL